MVVGGGGGVEVLVEEIEVLDHQEGWGGVGEWTAVILLEIVFGGFDFREAGI